MEPAPRRQSHANIVSDHAVYAGDLFGEFLFPADPETPKTRAVALFPGIVACGTGAAAAAWLAEHYGFPVILLGLLIGSSLNFLGEDPKVLPGLNFCSRYPLQLAIVLLGFQVSIVQVMSLGAWPFVALLLTMLAATSAGVIAAKLLRQPLELGILAGCATAICGGSAAFALYALMDRQRIGEAQFAVTMAGIAIASATAMSVYPMLAHELALNDAQAGFLIGASIHDVAQAIGGGYAVSNVAGQYATLIKLTRVALLGPSVMLVGWLLARRGLGREKGSRYAIPMFLLGFVAIAAVSSAIVVPESAKAAALAGSKLLLLVAVTATAMRTRLDLLVQVGFGGIGPVVAATVASFAFALTFCLL